MKKFLKISLLVLMAFVLPITANALIPLQVNQGGTGLSTVASGRVLFGNTPAGALNTSSNFTWDNNNTFAYIGDPTAIYNRLQTSSENFIDTVHSKSAALSFSGASDVLTLRGTSGINGLYLNDTAGQTVIGDYAGVTTCGNNYIANTSGINTIDTCTLNVQAKNGNISLQTNTSNLETKIGDINNFYGNGFDAEFLGDANQIFFKNPGETAVIDPSTGVHWLDIVPNNNIVTIGANGGLNGTNIQLRDDITSIAYSSNLHDFYASGGGNHIGHIDATGGNMLVQWGDCDHNYNGTCEQINDAGQEFGWNAGGQYNFNDSVGNPLVTIDASTAQTSILTGQIFGMTNISSGFDYTAGTNDYIIEMMPSSSTDVTLTLPGAATVGQTYMVKNKAKVLHNVIVDGNGNTIDGNATNTITGSLTVEVAKSYTWNGTEWSVY